MKNFILSTIIIFSLSGSAKNYLDTISKRLNLAHNDSERVEIYYQSLYFKSINKKSIDSLSIKLYEFTKSNNYKISVLAFLRAAVFESYRQKHKIALEHYLSALKISEKNNYYEGIMMIKLKLAALNETLENYELAIHSFHEAIYFSKKCNNQGFLAESYTQLGIAYKNINKIDSSLIYALKAIPIREALGKKADVANAYNNLALTYKKAKNYEKAIEFILKAIELRGGKMNKNFAGNYINLANCYKEIGKYKEAIKYAEEGTSAALKVGAGDFYVNGLGALADINYRMGNYKSSAMYYKLHKNTEDSLNSAMNKKNLQELQEKYESDKKDVELRKQEGDISLQKTRNRMKNILITFALIAIALAIIAIVFIFRSYARSKRNAKDLALKNKVIGQKNKEITDSINYAQNIQQSLLTGETVFKESVNDFFILFNPKDIVSGDFYWAKKVNSGFMVMCADCTGHGVPGAFMSLLGISHLNEITGTLNVHRPDLVLNELRKSLINGFGLKDNKDGMDASFVKINGQQLEMAAANNPVWIIRDKKNIVIKPNKFPIGKHHGQMQDFTLNTFDTIKNDLVIMLTDGYADQFGGPKNKKFKYRRLEELITSNSHLPLKDLKEILNKEITEWKGRNEQVDDVLVIGIRV